jgi:hypothetical protein
MTTRNFAHQTSKQLIKENRLNFHHDKFLTTTTTIIGIIINMKKGATLDRSKLAFDK